MDNEKAHESLNDQIIDTTTNEQNQTALHNDGGHAEIEEVDLTSPEEGLQTQHDVIPKADNESEELLRKVGKLSSIESELAKTKKELEEARQYRKTVEVLNEALGEDKETYERLATKLKAKGYNVPSYEQAYAQAQLSQQSNQVQGQSQTTQAPLTVDQIEEQLETKRQVREFVSEYSEFAPNENDDNETKAQKARKFQSIVTWAYDLKAENPKLSLKEAMEEAYYARPENRKKALERERQLGEQVGMAVKNGQAVTTGAGVGSSGSASSGSGGSGIQLTERDKQFCKKHGISEATYLETKRRNAG